MRTKLLLSVLLLMVVSALSAQYQLPKLNYSYSAFEPFIDSMTMNIHYNKHHAAYVNNVNTFFTRNPKYAGMQIEDLIANIGALPVDEQTLVRNSGGGHYNHTLFWSLLVPANKSHAHGAAVDAIIAQFGSLDNFKEQFAKAATGRFGSGWAWLVVDKDGKLQIGSTPNQDNPLMDVSPFKGKPILALDVWEHAYYLKYQSARADYVKAFWNIVNWEEVNRLYLSK